ncbi:MAG TPA: cache domain-containing protein [Chthoniobacterales bacterium]|jgi:signal transduction histidine kinase|nr:cache domain-containing protein [Chthoniobacterales bacterium]
MGSAANLDRFTPDPDPLGFKLSPEFPPGGFPKLEGTNSSSRKDSNGKLYWAEFAKVVKFKGSGWVDYMFPKPGQSQPSQKWSYVKAVNIDGTPGFVGAGFYPQ